MTSTTCVWLTLLFYVLGYGVPCAGADAEDFWEEKCEAMKECRAMLGTSLTHLSYGVMPQEQELNKTCSSLGSFKQCAQYKLPECTTRSAVGMFTEEKGILNYMCGDGRQGLERFSDCWNKTALMIAVKTCKKKQLLELEDIESKEMTQPENVSNQQYCGVLHDFTACLRKATEQSCSREPSCIMENISDMVEKHYYAYVPNCAPERVCANESSATTPLYSATMYVVLATYLVLYM